MPTVEEVDPKDVQQQKQKRKSNGNSVHKSIYKSISPDVTRELRTKRSNETLTKEVTKEATEEEGGARRKNSGEKNEKNSGEKGGIVVRCKNSKEDAVPMKKEEGVVLVRKKSSKDGAVPRSKGSKGKGGVRRKASNASNMSKYSILTLVPPSGKNSIMAEKPKIADSNHDAIREKSGQPASSDSCDFKTTANIPKTYFHSVDISIDLENSLKLEEVIFTHSMVVRQINKSSVMFHYLIVGDQVLQINEKFISSPEEFVSNMIHGKQKLKIIRPWNVHHLGDRLPSKTRKDSHYSIVDVYKFTGVKNGFELKPPKNKKCEVTKSTPKTRGGHAFWKNDRILDVDSQSVGKMSIQDIRRLFNGTLDRRGMCSFLVERDIGIKSSPNPSLCMVRGVVAMETTMGDDACEIGAREATRFLEMKNFKNKAKPIWKDANNAVVATEAAEETEESSKSKRKKKRKKRISMDGKNEVSRTPSDVKDPAALQKVTAKSGIVAFIRNAF